MDDPTTAGIRTSGSNPSLRPISNRTGSTRSTTSHFGNYRHALLKSNAQRKHSIEKDLPVPPVLSDGHLPSADGGTTQITRPEKSVSQIPIPTENPAHPTEPLVPSLANTEVKEAVDSGIRPPADEYDHFHTWRHPVSKVRPAVYGAEEDGRRDALDEDSSVNHTTLEKAYSVEDHFRHSHVDTPKVRPFTEFSTVQASHPQEGVQETQEAPTSNLIDESNSQGEEESQKEALYWGFLPRLGEKGSNQESGAGPSYPSQVSSQGSLTAVPHTNLESDPRQENLLQDQTKQKDPGASTVHSESKTSSRGSGKPSGGLLASISHTPPSSNHDNADKEQDSLLSQRFGTSRTAKWLRGLLGYPEAGNSPKLTKLPSKSPPRRKSRGDVNSTVSEMTTYSDENSANKQAMNSAMRSLEQLMTEALSLANEAGDRKYGHVDDGDLPLEPASEASIHTPSVHESIQHRSSEYGGVTFEGPLLDVANADVNNGGDGYKNLPPKSAKRPGLVKSVKQDGNIVRPSILKRLRHTASNTEIRYHSIDDDCVLPMPPPDCRIRRQSVYPGPLAYEDDDPTGLIKPRSGEVPNSREVREYIRIFHQPPICTRGSSKTPYEAKESTRDDADLGSNRLLEIRCQNISACSLDGGTSEEVVDFSTQYSPVEKRYPGFAGLQGVSRHARDEWPNKGSIKQRKNRGMTTKHVHELKNISLRNRSHVSIGEEQPFSFTKSARRQPTIARDWSPARKRFVAAVACTSTALVGVLVGIYAGLVPSIQYYIADFNHYTILGNVGLYLGMALPSLLCWPLPLLHGRKPYIVGGLCTAMPLLFPQAIAIGTRRSPYTCVWRVALLLSRALMGFFLGFASMNFHSILTDLFGASLMSKNPHQEVVDEYDVRRHGGGLGVWLGIWTWCFIGSLSVGFVVGAVVIEYLQPSWGLYISIVIIGLVLLLNVFCPEVRRSAWRRSVAEVRMGETISRRLARGEVMMHRVQTGPRWWGQEVYHGVALSLEMLRQPGFTIMAVYSAWIYAQIVLVIVLLGSLTSRSYRFRSPYVGAVVSSVAIGAFAAIPFQKANLFSRARKMGPKSNVMTFDKKITWSSRFVRRTIFTLFLPIAGIIYTIVSTGPPIHVVVPSVFAALIGFLSCLAISECNGMLMEAWDCSDLQPGMTGRSKSSKDSHKRTNYSSFPRATAGWNTIQSLGFIFAAGATGLGGSVTRQLGQKAATGIVAAILLVLSLLLLGTLIRFKRVQIIPDCTCSEMDRWTKERRLSYHNWAAAMAAAKENGTKELNEIPEDDVG
ncbi:hypothetical protein EV127DRAFT_170884 [Xylaria flabelliformis]|nr:hypothetical protein EV127DRAFT_170884 [Xylaria flabelliformis]